MTEQPARGWFSFRLWQLFAVMTVIACYFGWQVHIVRGRTALLKQMRARHYLSVTTAAEFNSRPGATGPQATVPFVRRCLGDEAIQSIGYYEYVGIPGNDIARLKSSFPEARVYAESPPLEPCHPGCFPHGTLVETPDGSQRIEEISVGDRVFMISAAGEKKSVSVMSIFRTHNRLWEVRTNRGPLLTTETQPLCVTLREHVPAGKLQPGDVILVWKDDTTEVAEVEHVRQTDKIVPVINLVLGNREPFIAGGFLARSKPAAEE